MQSVCGITAEFEWLPSDIDKQINVGFKWSIKQANFHKFTALAIAD